MSGSQKDEEKSASDNKRVAGTKVSEGDAPTKQELMRMKLKSVLHIAMLWFSPVAAVLAVVLAVFAFMGNQTAQKQLHKHGATIKSLKANLSASKRELKKLKMRATVASKKTSLLKEKLMKQDEQLALIVKNVTPLQVRMKISPTLATQLLPAASGVVVAEAVETNVAPATVKHVPEVKHKPKIRHKPKTVYRKPTPPKEQVVHSTPPSSKASQSSRSKKALSPEVQAMKEAIERFNRE